MDIEKKIVNLHNKAYRCKNKYLSAFFTHRLYKKYNCCIATNCVIGKNIIFPHPIGIVIGEGVTIGNNCTIYQNVTIGRKEKDIPKYPKIGNNVVIYCNSTILGDVTIGDNSIIGANSVILHDVPPNAVVAGNPAKIIKKVNNDEK